MRIWYQSYSAIGFDPRWRNYEEDLQRYVQQVARPDTRVDVHGVGKMSPHMALSSYIQLLHAAQVIENALQAERQGYDAFAIGGTLDLGHVYLREVLDIPVAFIAESSFYHACLLARKFGLIGVNAIMLQQQMALVAHYGLEQRCVPGVHLGSTMLDLVTLSGSNPQRLIAMVTEAARQVIAAGAGAIVVGFGAISSFLGQQGIHAVDDAPIVDIVAVVIKTAEMLADLHKMGVKRSRRGGYTYAAKEELLAARRLYGLD